ncbi:hypothetical protein FHW79_004490 [Azospirillum sp. OGB3]|uniref:hypothetical protein n=1 Tax=Azospirillum sp. OGB3 TaxID=2587012 RepID=UPI0017EE6153|nr:hypothetical protein [Azospirillum sp. OGB3]MBB3266843.1 hypothetical protein [Azospirillum sp. OGB3]
MMMPNSCPCALSNALCDAFLTSFVATAVLTVADTALFLSTLGTFQTSFPFNSIIKDQIKNRAV